MNQPNKKSDNKSQNSPNRSATSQGPGSRRPHVPSNSSRKPGTESDNPPRGTPLNGRGSRPAQKGPPQTATTQTSASTPSSRTVPVSSSSLNWVPSVTAPNIATRMERQKALGELVFQSRGVWADRTDRQRMIADRVLSRSKVMKTRNFQTIGRNDLELMAYAYDELFFDGICLPLAESYGLSFRLSSRMTRAGGKTTRTIYPPMKGTPSRTHYEIALSTSLLFQSFRNSGETIRVCGYDCPDRLTAMQRIVEHELIHLSEMLVWIQSDCAANRFQSIAHNMFGHTEHRHELITQQERALKEFNIRAGNRVSFRFEGKLMVGIVNRITRRATILVEDPRGQRFSDGRRYVKYYVPINQLRPIA